MSNFNGISHERIKLKVNVLKVSQINRLFSIIIRHLIFYST